MQRPASNGSKDEPAEAKYGSILGHAKLTDRFIPCEEIHIISCKEKAWGCWKRVFKMTLLMCAPVHFLPAFLSNYKQILSSRERGIEFLWSSSINTFRSVFFFSFFGLFFNMFICLLRNLRQTDDSLNPLLGGALSGSAILWEPAMRRSEFTLYCIPRILHIIWEMIECRQLAPARLVKQYLPSPLPALLIFSLALGMLMSSYRARKANVQQPAYRFLLKHLFD
jgi:hypothetical protein